MEFKRRPGGELLAQLARCLTASIRSGTLPGGGDLLVPVPARAGDGRHAAQLLARRIGRETGLPYGNILHFVRRTHTQRGLTRAQRLANLHRAIAVRPRSALLPSRVLVIDDVMTTGATVNECSRALKEAGVRQVGVLTLAQGDIGTMHEKQHGNDMV